MRLDCLRALAAPERCCQDQPPSVTHLSLLGVLTAVSSLCSSGPNALYEPSCPVERCVSASKADKLTSMSLTAQMWGGGCSVAVRGGAALRLTITLSSLTSTCWERRGVEGETRGSSSSTSAPQASR